MVECLLNFDEEGLQETVKEAVKSGHSIQDIADNLSKGMKVIGNKFEEGEFYVTELIMAGETAKSAFEILDEKYSEQEIKSKARIVIGTVRGDLHDIGKNLVSMILKSAGYHVFDLGVDVSAEQFVQKVVETGAEVIGLSALISTTLPYMRDVVEAFEKAKLRKKVKILIGGAPATQEYAERIGADKCADDAVHSINILSKWFE
jgi:5-methyltetrahydrofolate--homocysteine methyltransferase